MVLCTHRGCGKDYREDENTNDSCLFHPGVPKFHEGFKGWTCCNTKVTDFNDFLNIPGCATGAHSKEKLEDEGEFYKREDVEPEAIKKEGAENEKGPETYSMASLNAALPTIKIPTKEELRQKALEAEAAEIAKSDDTSISVKAGTTCKRRGCGYKFKSDSISRGEGEESECIFHSGAPVFHEGSKGWSCCKRKVLEFDEFLKIKGCKSGKHVFAEKEGEASINKVECRYDWYQSQTQVILSIFSKKADKNSTKIEFGKDNMNVSIRFQGNQLFERIFNFSSSIKPESSSYEILSSKVEIVLGKEDSISWPSLEKGEEITEWTTFGTNSNKD